MKKLNPKVLKIAEQVRRQCEKFVMSRESSGLCFHEQEHLDQMCDTASFALQKAMRLKGFHPKVIDGVFESWGHCWVRWGGWIIDITATQFNNDDNDFPPVYISRSDNDGYEEDKVYELEEWLEENDDRPDSKTIDRILSLKGKT